MREGHQTWVFPDPPRIISTATVGGPFEANGPLREEFDGLHGDLWSGQNSYEKAERKIMEEACEIAIKKADLQKEDIQLFLCGDLMNQIITSSFTARTLGVPYLGLFGACSSSMESLALAALIVNSGFGDLVL